MKQLCIESEVFNGKVNVEKTCRNGWWKIDLQKNTSKACFLPSRELTTITQTTGKLRLLGLPDFVKPDKLKIVVEALLRRAPALQRLTHRTTPTCYGSTLPTSWWLWRKKWVKEEPRPGGKGQSDMHNKRNSRRGRDAEHTTSTRKPCGT